MRVGQALEEAAARPAVITTPMHLRQASSVLYAELLGATSGVQMETVLEIESRNGFEA